jgi:hypothetical protein
VELYRQRKTPDLSTRALWESYQQSSCNKVVVETGEENYELSLKAKKAVPLHTMKELEGGKEV